MIEKLVFIKELEALINRYSKESESDTPDFILAMYLNDCLYSYNRAVKARDKWFNVNMWNKNNAKVIGDLKFPEGLNTEMEKLNKIL